MPRALPVTYRLVIRTAFVQLDGNELTESNMQREDEGNYGIKDETKRYIETMSQLPVEIRSATARRITMWRWCSVFTHWRLPVLRLSISYA